MEFGGRTWLTTLLCCIPAILAAAEVYRAGSNTLGSYSMRDSTPREMVYKDVDGERDVVVVNLGKDDHIYVWYRNGVQDQSTPSSYPTRVGPSPPPGDPGPWATTRGALHPPRLLEGPSRLLLPTAGPTPTSSTLNHLLYHGTTQSRDGRLIHGTKQSEDHRGTTQSQNRRLIHGTTSSRDYSSPHHQHPTPPQPAPSTPPPSSSPHISSLRHCRSAPPVPPSLASQTETEASPGGLSSSVAPLRSVRQLSSSNSHFPPATRMPAKSQSDNSHAPQPTFSNSSSRTLFIPVLVPNIPDLFPYLQKSGLYIPEDVPPIPVSSHQIALAQHSDRTSPSMDLHSSDEHGDRLRHSSKTSTTSDRVPAAVSHPIHITINIVPEALGQTSFTASSHADVSQTHQIPKKDEQVSTDFPTVPPRPLPAKETPLPYHIAYFPAPYPSPQGAQQPSPSPASIMPTHPISDSPLPNASREEMPQPDRGLRPLLFTPTPVTTSTIQESPTPASNLSAQVTPTIPDSSQLGLLDTRVSIRPPLRPCENPCEIRNPATEVCVLDLACDRNAREIL